MIIMIHIMGLIDNHNLQDGRSSLTLSALAHSQTQLSISLSAKYAPPVWTRRQVKSLCEHFFISSTQLLKYWMARWTNSISKGLEEGCKMCFAKPVTEEICRTCLAKASCFVALAYLCRKAMPRCRDHLAINFYICWKSDSSNSSVEIP